MVRRPGSPQDAVRGYCTQGQGRKCAKSLVVVSVGNTLRGDDGIAQALCRQLLETYNTRVCYFDIGPYTCHLPACLNGHDAAIVVDAIEARNGVGRSSIVDLRAVVDRGLELCLRSSHGLSLLDELALPEKGADLPPSIHLFGVEVNDVGFGEGLSKQTQLCLPGLVDTLANLIEELIKEVPANA